MEVCACFECGLIGPARRGAAVFIGHRTDPWTVSLTFELANFRLSSGRRPTCTSKSDEFYDANVIVIEPQRCENTDFAVK